MARQGWASRWLRILVPVVFLAASAAILLREFRWREVAGLLEGARVLWILGSGGAVLLAFGAIRTMRWRCLLRGAGLRVAFWDLYLATVASFAAGVLLPLQAGEALKVEMLRGRGLLPRGPGYAIFGLERLLDVGTVCALAVATHSSAAVLGRRPGLRLFATALFLAAIPVGAAAMAPALTRRVPLRGRLAEVLRYTGLSTFTGSTLSAAAALTVCAWALVALAWQSFLKAVVVEIGFLEALRLMSTVTIVSIASLVPGGLGISEVGIAVGLGQAGIAPARAQAGALVIRLITLLLFASGAVHYAVWRRRGVRRREEPAP